jgi:hypothetical protein
MGPCDYQDDDHDEPMQREPDEIEMHELDDALRGLAVLGEDTFLGMQATNVALVDKWLMPIETEARGWRFRDEGIDVEGAMFLNAQSQMWMFAVYEFLRTWRERAKNIQKWASSGGLSLKIAALERDQSFLHVNKAAFVDLLKRALAEPALVSSISDDLSRTHVLFGQLEFLRIALAKHQVSGKAKQMAYAPGYARIDMWTGSMSYELSNGAVILGEVTRRSIADGLRSIAVDRRVPSKEELASFDAFMRFSPDGDPFDPARTVPQD